MKFLKKIFYTKNKEAKEFSELLHILEHFLDIKDSQTILTSLKYNYKKLSSFHFLDRYPIIGKAIKNIYSKYSQIELNKFGNTELIYFRDDVRLVLIDLKKIFGNSISSVQNQDKKEQEEKEDEDKNDLIELSQVVKLFENFLQVQDGNAMISGLKNNRGKLLSQDFLKNYEEIKLEIKKLYYNYEELELEKVTKQHMINFKNNVKYILEKLNIQIQNKNNKLSSYINNVLSKKEENPDEIGPEVATFLKIKDFEKIFKILDNNMMEIEILKNENKSGNLKKISDLFQNYKKYFNKLLDYGNEYSQILSINVKIIKMLEESIIVGEKNTQIFRKMQYLLFVARIKFYLTIIKNNLDEINDFPKLRDILVECIAENRPLTKPENEINSKLNEDLNVFYSRLNDINYNKKNYKIDYNVIFENCIKTESIIYEHLLKLKAEDENKKEEINSNMNVNIQKSAVELLDSKTLEFFKNAEKDIVEVMKDAHRGKINSDRLVSLYRILMDKEFLLNKYENESIEFLKIYKKVIYGLNEGKYNSYEIFLLANQIYARIMIIKFRIYFKLLINVKEDEKTYLDLIPYRINALYDIFSKSHVGETAYAKIFLDFRTNFAVLATQMQQHINYDNFPFTKKDLLKTIFMLNKLLLNVEFDIEQILKRNLK